MFEGGRVGALVKLGGRAQKWREVIPVSQQQALAAETGKDERTHYKSNN